MAKKIWRPFNTWGIVLIGFVVVSVLSYSLNALGDGLTIEVDADAGTCEVVIDEVVTVTPPPEPPPPVVDDDTDLGLWSQSAWGLHNYRIRRGVVSSFSFTADEFDRRGVITFTNNMPNLSASGHMFRSWISEEPNGPVLNNDTRCGFYSSDPNPWRMQWIQNFSDTRFDCNLGYEVRELYLNMAVGCWEGHGNGRCNVGEPYSRDYFIRVYPEWAR